MPYSRTGLKNYCTLELIDGFIVELSVTVLFKNEALKGFVG